MQPEFIRMIAEALGSIPEFEPRSLCTQSLADTVLVNCPEFDRSRFVCFVEEVARGWKHCVKCDDVITMPVLADGEEERCEDCGDE